MTRLVILDDSICYFTNPADIQKAYGKFWDEGIPITLAVTPAIKGTSNDNVALIPPAKQNDSSPFKIPENKQLCSYLNTMADQRLVEICMRGYHGILNEFDTDDDVLLQQKIEDGRAELEHAFPAASHTTFVMPPQQYSTTAQHLLVEYDYSVCVYHTNPAKQSTIETLPNDRMKFHYPPTLFTDTKNTSQEIENLTASLQQDKLIVVRTAYWRVLAKDFITTWYSVIDTILSSQDTIIDTFMYIPSSN